MKQMVLSIFFFLLLFCLFVPGVHAHELYIDVEEFSEREELRVDVVWGHIRDYMSEASHKDYQLSVRYPDGEEEQLELEAAGVSARAYVPISDEGDYIFWAERKQSTYTPDDSDTTQLSSQMAKLAYHVGDGNTTAEDPVDLELEIIPEINIADFSTGRLEGQVTLNGEPVGETTVTAYGPEHEVLEQVSDQDGKFTFDVQSTGKWLIKANVVLEESGSIDGEEYEETSHTSTLLLDTNEEEPSSNNSWTLVAMLVIGLFIGATIMLLVQNRKN
ncbi:DUF4198 domain-containing protein [Aquibacillus sediminis]|uniref:DUF4198 domain-containing protein n=1 Tax=Aquibacillus sediminis TaxID=2574734 RepID=UPI001485E4F3|nr:DUF4198 domain-containing protein [Aquibacillus sediminis]